MIFGAAVSSLVAGSVAVAAGDDAALLSLGAPAGAGFLWYLIAMPETAQLTDVTNTTV